MEKRELIRKVKEITDLTSEEKSYLIELINNKKKYGLVWENKPEDVEEQLRSMLPVLKEDKKKAIISNDKEAPNHILIEGDNLHALTTLSFTHKGKIDVIYIDPPYNTGNKDFIYNDHYIDKEDSYRHSKWLSFMEKRLRIAQELLSDTGVMFISIDDNEVAQLKLLLTEIFNEFNFLANIVWANQEGGGSSDSKHFRVKHEYILCFAKNKTLATINGVAISNIERYKQKDEYIRNRGPYYTQKLGMGSIQYSESLDYPIVCPDGSIVYPKDNNNGKRACWRWSEKKYEWGLNKGFIEFKKNKKGVWTVYTKQYLNCDNEGTIIERLQRPLGIIEKYSSTQASKNLEDIRLKHKFNYSKPVSLINYILELSCSKKSVILDFFAGSGTTLHAAMELNKEDGGKRQCILVTNNENKIAEEVTYERNRKIIQGYTNAKKEEVEGLSKNNLRYYKADFVPSEQTEQNRRHLTKYSTELICIKENCYIEITDLYQSEFIQAPLVRIFTNNLGKHLILIYHSHFQHEVIQELIELIPKLKSKEKVKIYSFSPEKETIEEEFRTIRDKIDAIPLPDSIYNAYKQCFRTIQLDKNHTIVSHQSTEN